ncbi:TIGR03936 family radical SAM-associated protein [Clostridium cochlearium]|uniref:TIGR03936 family radical SAM-associated protein n=1 Tax=Clostridium cochlearium TaxID=1494 RepID=UPI000B94ACD0|nr:TIGR03936 family radical SAM-associated protein [Clostridium cochlearium]MCR1971620.1 TIGR03936 family radical SAM-associated protein [Clostridium cochlearium]MDU1442006.1 TIGR03936 family radical SAM-associated protein [Clostridium cochlearium]SNV85182.1 radical SAM-linked protein [Clostridium cochlearium]STA93274.1 radical SAM-linked protein [Clostridium cochlearium]
MKVRYLIKFTKGSSIKFISHLDLMKTLQRIIKRSAIPIEYSKGFNPHMTMSIAQPLSVGIYSEGEYMDIELTEDVDTNTIKNRLNKSTTRNIEFLEVIKIEDKEGKKKTPKSMAAIDAARYKIKMRYNNTESLEEELKILINLKNWNTIKKTKRGENEADIKPLVKEISYTIDEKNLYIDCVLSCGSRENLSADLFSQYIKNNTSNCDLDAFIDIKRQELYGIKGDKYIPLYDFLK